MSHGSDENLPEETCKCAKRPERRNEALLSLSSSVFTKQHLDNLFIVQIIQRAAMHQTVWLYIFRYYLEQK